MSLGKIFKRARSALLDWAIPEESLAVGRRCRPTTSRDLRSRSVSIKSTGRRFASSELSFTSFTRTLLLPRQPCQTRLLGQSSARSLTLRVRSRSESGNRLPSPVERKLRFREAVGVARKSPIFGITNDLRSFERLRADCSRDCWSLAARKSLLFHWIAQPSLSFEPRSRPRQLRLFDLHDANPKSSP